LEAKMRLTGVTLNIDFGFYNYKHGDDDRSDGGGGTTYSWGRHNVVCIMTVTQNIGWSSLGSDIVESSVTRKLQAPRGGTQAIYMGVGTTKDVYRQGVNMVYKSHGEIGSFDFFDFINTFTNALVLLGAATTITTLVAVNTGIIGQDGAILSNYTYTLCTPEEVYARTCAQAASQAGTFMRNFDPHRRGHLCEASLFRKLKLILHRDLTDEQIAQVTDDCFKIADMDDDNKVSLDEFCTFITKGDANLHNVVLRYKDENGNPEKLAEYKAVPKTQEEHDMENMQGAVQQGSLFSTPSVTKVHPAPNVANAPCDICDASPCADGCPGSPSQALPPPPPVGQTGVHTIPTGRARGIFG